MDKKYCIFDMDGTLVDSMPYWGRLSVDFLNSRGIPGDFSDLMKRIRTMTTPEACVVLKREFSLPDTPDEIEEELSRVMRGHYERDIGLKEGVRSCLETLRAQGCRLCIVTATALPLVPVCLQRLGIMDLFEFILSCEEVGRGKDHPDAFLEAARRLGSTPQETAVFEDALQALRTAKEAGFYTAAVYDPAADDSWQECVRTADEAVRDWKILVERES